MRKSGLGVYRKNLLRLSSLGQLLGVHLRLRIQRIMQLHTLFHLNALNIYRYLYRLAPLVIQYFHLQKRMKNPEGGSTMNRGCDRNSHAKVKNPQKYESIHDPRTRKSSRLILQHVGVLTNSWTQRLEKIHQMGDFSEEK